MKPSIYIDYGAGYVAANAANYSNALQFQKTNEDFVRQRTNLSGSITFWGAELTLIKAEIAADKIELPIKVYINSIEQGEYFMSLQADYDENTGTGTFGAFTTNDIYATIAAQADKQFPFWTVAPAVGQVVQINETSVIYYSIPITTTLAAPLDYKVTTDPEGNTTLSESVFWSYFVFVDTVNLGGGQYKHRFATAATFTIQGAGYDYVFGSYDLSSTIDGATPAILENGFLDAFATPSTVTVDILEATDTYTSLNSLGAYLAKNVGIQVTLTAPTCTYLDLKEYILGSLTRIKPTATDPKEPLSISFNDYVTILQNNFQLQWYVESGVLKFLHPTEFPTGADYDISTTTANQKRYTYAPESRPRFEKIVHSNSFADDFNPTFANIEYTRNTADEVVYDSGRTTSDIGNCYTNLDTVETNGLFLFAKLTADLSTSATNIVLNGTGILSGKTVVNNACAPSYLLANHFTDWRYATTGEVNGTPETFNTTIARPIYQLPQVSLANVLPSDIDLTDTFVHSLGDCLGKEYSYDCNTGTGQLTLVK